MGLFERYAKDPVDQQLVQTINKTADPENMLVMLQTWQSGDCSLQDPYNGNFEKAMQSIKAKTLVLPGKTDLYFP